MKVLTYFSFTLLSIIIQFSVMDFLQSNEEKGIDLNLTSPKTRLHDIIKDLGIKPHALYYNTQKSYDINKNFANKKIYRNASSADKEQSNTDTTSTVFDILLYENNSITKSDFTTDSEYTTIGFDNVTEITLFVPKNETNSKSNETSSLKYNLDCDCNLLYEVCDINCCCDSDCDNYFKEMFNCLYVNKKTQSNEITEHCFSPLSHSGKSQNIIDNLFCIVKENLPEHRKIISKHNYVNTAADNKYLKWQQSEKPKYFKEFTKMQYKIGDPVWLLQNTSVSHMNLPTLMVNNYCAGRKPITFFKDEVINCIVKYRDLEMFRILKIAERSTVISAKDTTINSTALNCTTLHCTNWTILVSDGVRRESYNKKKHEPVCNEHTCANIALNIDYFFHYYDSRIANVSVILHIRDISTALIFMSQRINVKFLLGNKSDEQMLEFSGCPGYKKGLMLLISSSEGNYTDSFYQSNISQEKYLSLPINVNGQCVSPNSKQDFTQFGINKRIKCRYFHNRSHNDVNVCRHIQGNITELFRLNNKTFISPYGNPYDLKDEDWIQLRVNSFYNESVYEKNGSSIHCYNVIKKITLTFVFMSVNHIENNTILSLNVGVSMANISFNILEDITTIVTTDINFINVSKRPILEYAGRPHLNINIPKDFFISYPSNNSKGNYKFILNKFSYSAVCIIFLLL